MMRQMRENTKWIMLVTAAAFVALMVFEWGMDASGQSGGGGDIGQVGGTSVDVRHYQNVYRNLYDQIQRSQEQSISTAQNREIEDMAWNEVVNQILIENELDRRGIGVSDDEIRAAVRTSPPPQFRSDPSFQTDGQFDPAKYQQFLQQAAAQDPRFLMQLEQYYRDVIPRSKLMRQVSSGVYVTDRELWQDWRDRNETAQVSFLELRADDRIPSSEVEVTSEEVEAHYREHQEEFAVPARARVRYTFLPRTPTAADSAAVEARVAELRQQLVEGADFAELAEIESADQASASDGGNLGTIGPGDMPSAFEEVAFSLPVGEISEPVLTPQGWHIIEVLSRDEQAEEDEQAEGGEEPAAEVRHILIPVERTDQSEIELLTQADSLEALGENQPLEEAAAALGLPVQEGEITEDFALLSGVGDASEAQSWIFVEGEGPGAASPVFENSNAFYMIEVLGVAPAGHLPLEQVAGEIEEELLLRKKVDRAMEEAASLLEEARGGTSLEELAEREGARFQTTEPFTRNEFVPGLGLQSAAVGAAFGTPEGELAGPVAVDGRVLLLRVDDKEEADREAWEAQKEVQRAQLIATIRQERLQRWIEGLREVTEIRDQRAEFFRRAEEMADQQMPLAF